MEKSHKERFKMLFASGKLLCIHILDVDLFI